MDFDSGLKEDFVNNNCAFNIVLNTDTTAPPPKNNTHESTKPKSVRKCFTPQTPEWLVQRIEEDSLSYATGLLHAWMPTKREKEATEQTVRIIKAMDNAKALKAVESLKENKRFVRGTRGSVSDSVGLYYC